MSIFILRRSAGTPTPPAPASSRPTRPSPRRRCRSPKLASTEPSAPVASIARDRGRVGLTADETDLGNRLLTNIKHLLDFRDSAATLHSLTQCGNRLDGLPRRRWAAQPRTGVAIARSTLRPPSRSTSVATGPGDLERHQG